VSKTAISTSAANVKQALRYRYKTLIFNFDESPSVWFSSLWVQFGFGFGFGVLVWFSLAETKFSDVVDDCMPRTED